MIDFRYHVVSLISVFLAVALGIVIGTTQLNGQVLTNLNSQVSNLSSDKRALEARSQTLEAQLSQGDTFDQAVAPLLVANALPGARVLLIVASDSVDTDVRDQTITLLQSAGATVTGQIQLNTDYSDPQKANDLQNFATGEGLPPGITLPSTDNAGQLVGGLLASVLMSPVGAESTVASTSTTTVLAGLTGLGVLSATASGTDIGNANYAVILTAESLTGDDAADRNTTLTDLASALDTAGSGTVIAGDLAANATGGLIAAVRADAAASTAMSTVDNIDSAAGRVAAVLSLSSETTGTSGQYGVGDNTSPLPPLG